MIKILVEIIAQAAIFLELSDEETIPLEIAVKQQEDMAFKLQQLSQEERREFIKILNEIAKDNPNREEKEVLLKLPEAVGIT